MSKDIKSTLKKRYEKLLLKVNELWKLEKEKAKLRENRVYLNKDIQMGHEQSGYRGIFDKHGTAQGNILLNKESVKGVSKEIDEIKEKQVQVLEEIKKMINID